MNAQRPRLLVVDDEARILSALRRTLRREGYLIFTAESAAEAERLLEGQAVDAVLSDQKMPGESGVALLDRVRERWPRAARLLISGWPDEIPQEQIEAVGIQAVIPKPWDDASLKATLAKFLR